MAGFLALPAIVISAVSVWSVKQLASVGAKVGFTTYQTGIALAILVANGLVITAYVAIVYQIYQLFQTVLDWFFGLSSSPIEVIKVSFDILKSLGIWDGMIDALTLVLPILELIIVIKLSKVLVKILDRFNEMSDRIIKTILSNGL